MVLLKENIISNGGPRKFCMNDQVACGIANS